MKLVAKTINLSSDKLLSLDIKYINSSEETNFEQTISICFTFQVDGSLHQDYGVRIQKSLKPVNSKQEL